MIDERDSPGLFLCGMIRSGTTLLAKMFKANPACAMAWDILVPFLMRRTGNDRSLEHAMPDGERTEIMHAVIESARVHAPALIPRLEKISARTDRDLFMECMACVRDVYGTNGATKLTGIKECWVDGAAEHLAGAFPHLFVIQIVRDPRAVVASQSGKDRYPLLFMVEYWRQSANLALYYRSLRDEWTRRYLLIRYEDLVSDPVGQAQGMCRFLGLPFSPEMVQAENFHDGAGNRAPGNSSYGAQTRISTDSMERWREVLSKREVALIESLCAKEMATLGYRPIYKGGESTLWSLYRYRDPRDRLAEWQQNSPYLTGRHRGLLVLRELLRDSGPLGAALMPAGLRRRLFWNRCQLAELRGRSYR